MKNMKLNGIAYRSLPESAKLHLKNIEDFTKKLHKSDDRDLIFNTVLNDVEDSLTTDYKGRRLIFYLSHLEKVPGFTKSEKETCINSAKEIMEMVKKVAATAHFNGYKVGLSYSNPIKAQHLSIIVTEKNCKEQLIHTDFDRENAKELGYENYLSVNKTLVLCSVIIPLTARTIRVIPGSHKINRKDCPIDKIVNLELELGKVYFMHPLFFHSGGSNKSNELSLCLHAYIGVKSIIDFNSSIHLLDHKKYKNDVNHLYRKISHIKDAGYGLFTKRNLKVGYTIEYKGKVINKLPSNSRISSSESYFKLKNCKRRIAYLHTTRKDTGKDNMAVFAQKHQEDYNAKIKIRDDKVYISITKPVKAFSEIILKP